MNYYNYKYIHLLFITELQPNDEKKLNSLKRKITTIFFLFFFVLRFSSGRPKSSSLGKLLPSKFTGVQMEKNLWC